MTNNTIAKKTKHLLCFAMCSFFAINAFAESDKDFEFYKSIPRYESIQLSGQNISIIIHPDYTVSLSASQENGKTLSRLSGGGQVVWDVDSKTMKLELAGVVSGSYSDSEDIYRTEKHYNVGSTTAQFLGFNASTYSYKRVYDHTEYYRASGSREFEISTPLHVDGYGGYSINSNRVSATLTGDRTFTVYYDFIDGSRSLSYGESKSTNLSINDEFGMWQWTKDKSELFLYSTNMHNDMFKLIRAEDGPRFKLMFDFHGKELVGVASSSTDIGKMIQLDLAFEDGTKVTLPFVEEKKEDEVGAISYTYTYATYNRFMEEWNWEASSMVDQLKDKINMIISYQIDGSKYTSLFELEGLETIMSYLQ